MSIAKNKISNIFLDSNNAERLIFNILNIFENTIRFNSSDVAKHFQFPLDLSLSIRKTEFENTLGWNIMVRCLVSNNLVVRDECKTPYMTIYHAIDKMLINKKLCRVSTMLSYKHKNYIQAVELDAYISILNVLNENYYETLFKLKNQIAKTDTITQNAGSNIYVLLVNDIRCLSATRETIVDIYRKNNIHLVVVADLFPEYDPFFYVSKMLPPRHDAIIHGLSECNKRLMIDNIALEKENKRLRKENNLLRVSLREPSA